MASGLNHHRNFRGAIGTFIIGDISLSTTPVEVKVGSTILERRTQMFIINDSSNLVFLSDKPNFVPGVDTSIQVFSGEVITIDVDPNPADGNPERFYVALDEGTNTIRVAEAN